MAETKTHSRSPWTWIPSLYFLEGIPYVMVMTVAVVFYKQMGVGNGDIAFYTSLLYLPWVIKPFWSPFVDLFRTKRFWIILTQLILGSSLALVALTTPGPSFFKYSLAVFWLMAFSSATHDIAADGFYMLAMPSDQQAFFVGIRSSFYRLAMLTGQGLLVMLAGYLESSTGSIPQAWTITFAIIACLFIALALYHMFVLPRPLADRPMETKEGSTVTKEFLHTFKEFFKKKRILWIMAFLLLYRLGEAQLVKLAQPFMLDPREAGGLGLSTKDVGFVYGTVGIIALTAGGILGGILAGRRGLKFWLLWMALAINLPDVVYIYMAYAQPESFHVINLCVAIEQFGYGFGFTAYMLFMIYSSEGKSKTAHFAITTGFMALGMMLPGMWSGALQESVGYRPFFVWVTIATIPGILLAAFIKVDPEFGKRKKR